MGILIDYICAAAEDKKKDAVTYLLDTAKNAEKCVLATNIGKFTQPDVKVCAYVLPQADPVKGLIYTAAEKAVTDVYLSGGAACMPTAKLLLLKLEDGQNVYQHIKLDSKLIRNELETLINEEPSADFNYDDIRELLLKAKIGSDFKNSDQRLKQVYFPVDDDYHLLTVLPSSSLLYTLKTKINQLNDNRKQARDKKSPSYGKNYRELRDLTATKYGGTKPQNISLKNSDNGGNAYLIPAMPPLLKKREIRRPYDSFFKELSPYDFKDNFIYLHRCYNITRNNMDIRQLVREAECIIIDKIMARVYALRQLEPNWSENTKLSVAEHWWLDSYYFNLQEDTDDYLEEIAQNFTRWFIASYKQINKNSHFTLGDAEFNQLHQEIMAAITIDKEV